MTGLLFLALPSSISIALNLLLVPAITTSYIRLPPVQKSHIRNGIFRHAVLAAISLVVTCYYTLNYLDVSYRSWALTHNFPAAVNSSPWQFQWYSDPQVSTWLKEAQLFRDAWELVIETPARAACTLPLILTTLAWSIYVAKQSQRHNIKHGWAYVALALSCSTSFSVNLFYIAVLTHPAPKEKDEPQPDSRSLRSEKVPPKTPTTTTLLTPPTQIYTTLLPLTFIATMLLLTSPSSPSPSRLPLTLSAIYTLLTMQPLITPLFSRFPSTLTTHPTRASYTAHYRAQLELILLFGALMQGAMLFITGTATDWDGKHKTRHANVYAYPDVWGRQVAEGKEGLWVTLARTAWDHPVVARGVVDLVGMVGAVVVWSWA